jgi:hypothetical protein
MTAEDASPEPPDRATSDAVGEQAEKTHPPKRYGVVEIARHLKHDGRALLLYTRVEEDPT